MRAMKPVIPSVRIWPDNWLGPMNLDGAFEAPGPMDVDLGCGKGRFLVARAKGHPEVNFLGIDRMLERIRKIDNRVRRLGLRNVRLLRVEGYYAVAHLLPAASVRTYFIFHPDPWPKNKHRGNRLFNPTFVEALHRTLVPGGVAHIQTDHIPYFEQIRKIMGADPRFEEGEPFVTSPEEQTDFELWYLDKGPIGRCTFRKK